MKYHWPLMGEIITENQRMDLAKFILSTTRYTQGPQVKEFEDQWSKWLGTKYSVFVTSGSTANYVLVAAIKERYNLKDGDKVLVPANTWVTSISPIIQNNLTPIFYDISLDNFGPDEGSIEKIKQKHSEIKFAFVTHLLGLPANLNSIKKYYPEIIIGEDVCESHGTTVKDNKAGTLGAGSTFSFYFGHHMTTVEGGMVCTNDKELYNLIKIKRSHGLARELPKEQFKSTQEKYPTLHPQFIFLTDGYNFRNTELYAFLGQLQLKDLDNSIKIRRQNYKQFREMLLNYLELFHIPQEEGNSSFCLPFICKTAKLKEYLSNYLETKGYETRPIIAGNLLRQPFLREFENETILKNSDIVHHNGLYIGNSQLITQEHMNNLEDDIEKAIKEYTNMHNNA